MKLEVQILLLRLLKKVLGCLWGTMLEISFDDYKRREGWFQCLSLNLGHQ